MVGFNTQPPEGGWRAVKTIELELLGFNTQPPEGGWLREYNNGGGYITVSTHSRPKAAG